MADKIQIKRGLKADLPTLSVGELAYCTDTGELFIGTDFGNVLINGGGVLVFDTVEDVQSAYPNGLSQPVWVKSENNWYYWDTEESVSDTEPPVVSVSHISGTYQSNQTVTMSVTDNSGSATIYYTLDGSIPTTSSAVYNGAITISETTTLRFFAIDGSGNQSEVQNVTFTIEKNDSSFSPENIGGLHAWFDANTLSYNDGETITQWDDVSGNNRHGIQGALNIPTMDTDGLNGKPTVMFLSGKSLDVEEGVPIGDGSQFTVFVVAYTISYGALWGNLYSSRNGSTAGSIALWNGKTDTLRFYNKTDSNVATTTNKILNNVPFVGSFTYDNNTLVGTVSLNGGSVESGTATVANPERAFQIGGYNNQSDTSWNGGISEVIVYDKVLTIEERRQVEQYLADKWGVTLL